MLARGRPLPSGHLRVVQAPAAALAAPPPAAVRGRAQKRTRPASHIPINRDGVEDAAGRSGTGSGRFQWSEAVGVTMAEASRPAVRRRPEFQAGTGRQMARRNQQNSGSGRCFARQGPEENHGE